MADVFASTPYDDVFRTLLNDCTNLILPVINELFGEHYTGEERIAFGPNEHFLERQDEERKIITDSAFTVSGVHQKKYHIECQSTSDSSMLIRMFEYESQIALDDGSIEGNQLTVRFPHSGILFLRHTKTTPDEMQIQMETPGGKLSYPVKVLKLQLYTIEGLFEKGLYFLIPFYIFTHEKELSVYDTDQVRLEELKKEFDGIHRRLEDLADTGKINEYEKCTIMDMTGKVVSHLAFRYKRVREGVKSIMGGKVLEYEAKDILRRGIAEGRAEGKSEGQNLLVSVVQRLRAGQAPEEIIKSGVDEKTVELALTIR